MINKIFIIGPVYPKKSWEKPFYLYANSLSQILTKNNIPNTITLNTNEPQENDLSFIFYPYNSDDKKLKGYIIYINSESINIRKCILAEIKNPKIKMIWDYRNDNISTLQKITKTPILTPTSIITIPITTTFTPAITTTPLNTPINPCIPNPCKNGGTCQIENNDGFWKCICPDGYIGRDCGFSSD